MRRSRLLPAAMLAILVAGCSAGSPGWTYAPAASPTWSRRAHRPRPAARLRRTSASRRPRFPAGALGDRLRFGLGRGIRGSVRRRGGRYGLHDRGSNRPLGDADVVRARRSAVRVDARQPGPASRTTSRSSTRAGAEVFKGAIVRRNARETYQVPALAAGWLQVRVHRPPEHDRHAHGRVGAMTEASATATPTRDRSRRASSRSTAARRPLVVLDRTVFYPGGGGQPSDRGLLLRAADGRTWTSARRRRPAATIAHEIEGDGRAARRRRRGDASSSTGPAATR